MTTMRVAGLMFLTLMLLGASLCGEAGAASACAHSCCQPGRLLHGPSVAQAPRRFPIAGLVPAAATRTGGAPLLPPGEVSALPLPLRI